MVRSRNGEQQKPKTLRSNCPQTVLTQPARSHGYKQRPHKQFYLHRWRTIFYTEGQRDRDRQIEI